MRNYTLLWREEPAPEFVDVIVKWDTYRKRWNWDVGGCGPANSYGWVPISRITGYARSEKAARRQASRAAKAILEMKPRSSRSIERTRIKLEKAAVLRERKRKTFKYRIPPK